MPSSPWPLLQYLIDMGFDRQLAEQAMDKSCGCIDAAVEILSQRSAAPSLPTAVMLIGIDGGLRTLNGRYELCPNLSPRPSWRSVTPLSPNLFAWLYQSSKGDWLLASGNGFEPPRMGQPVTVMLRSDSTEYSLPTLVEAFVVLAPNGFFIPSSARCIVDEAATLVDNSSPLLVPDALVVSEEPETTAVPTSEPSEPCTRERCGIYVSETGGFSTSRPGDAPPLPERLTRSLPSELLPDMARELHMKAFRDFTVELVLEGYFPGPEPSSFSTYLLPPARAQDCEALAQELVPEAAAASRTSTVLSWRRPWTASPTVGRARFFRGSDTDGEEESNETARRTRLFTLFTTGDGNCLLNAVSLSLWGVNASTRVNIGQTETEPIRMLLHNLMSSPGFQMATFPRFQAEEAIAHSRMDPGFRVDPEEGNKDEWASLIGDCLLLGRALTPLHVYALTQVMLLKFCHLKL